MYSLLNSAQVKSAVDSELKLQALTDAELKGRDYAGGMHWKSIAGRDYLYRTHDRRGNGKSMGVRSEKTEQIYDYFTRGKASSTERIRSLREEVDIQAKINAAYRVGHVPNEVADICIELERAGLMEKSLTVIGTNAMHVYEAMAGVRFSSDIKATVDLDLLWNHHVKLSLGANDSVKEEGLIGVLKKADRTFEVMDLQKFRASSSRGYMVDLIRQMPDPPWADEPDRFFQDDLVATDIWNMKWLLGAPRVEHTVVAMNGRPFRMWAPDPRAFAMFKLWLSTAEDREPMKKIRDAEQARAVIQLVEDRLPHLARSWTALRSFPKDVVDVAMEEVRRERERS